MFWIFLLILIAVCGTAAVAKGLFWYAVIVASYWFLFHFLPWLFGEGIGNMVNNFNKFIEDLENKNK